MVMMHQESVDKPLEQFSRWVFASRQLCVQITPATERLLIKKIVTAPEMITQLFYNCAGAAITNVNECH